MPRKYGSGRRSHGKSQARFAQVPGPSVSRSAFQRDSTHKTTLDGGFLVPVFCDEVLPGDTFSCATNMLGRLATPIKPIMDSMFLDFFFFFVPLRLLWSNFPKFMGEQTNPGDSTDFLIPQLQADNTNGFLPNTIMDYLGVPTSVPDISVSALPKRAYHLIWNEWFRDENLQDSIAVPLDDGPDLEQLGGTVLKRGKRHDYFTSALPFPQKGPDVALPLGTTAPINSIGDGEPTFDFGDQTAGKMFVRGSFNVVDQGDIEATLIPTGNDANMRWDDPKLEADLTAAVSASINTMREAVTLQQLYERDARGGTRYTEIIKSHFGVDSPDQRLQRPEFLGGGSSRVYTQSVPQTQESGGSTPQGNLAAFGVVNATGRPWTKSFVEHGIILGMVCLRADLTYQQGIPKQFLRRTRFDFFWPDFANLGEQSVLNKEIFAQGTAADDDTFGYQERYAEYRYKNSQITGKFRSTNPQSLDVWHLSQDFASLPALNTSFIEEDPPFDRVVAVPSEPDLLLDCYFQLQCVRPMPVYSIPGLKRF